MHSCDDCEHETQLGNSFSQTKQFVLSIDKVNDDEHFEHINLSESHVEQPIIAESHDIH